MTTRPAASGSRRQPLISRITSRKNAATSAPETSSNATFAPMCGRSTGPESGGTRTPRSVSSARSTTGAWTRKIDSQPNSCVRMPPAAGPSAAPITPARAQMRAAGTSPPARSASRASAPQTTAAPAAPWTARAETSSPNDGAKRADERCRCEEDDAGAEDPSRAATREEGSRQSCEREREVVRRQRPGERGDLDVVASEDLRQRERDDGRVGQDEADRQPEQTDTGACLRAVLLSCRSCRPDPATSRRCRHSRTRRAAPRPSRST